MKIRYTLILIALSACTAQPQKYGYTPLPQNATGSAFRQAVDDRFNGNTPITPKIACPGTLPGQYMNVSADNWAPSNDITLTAAQYTDMPSGRHLDAPLNAGFTIGNIWGTQGVLADDTHLELSLHCTSNPCQVTVDMGVSNVPASGTGLWASCPNAPWNGDDHPGTIIEDFSGYHMMHLQRTERLYPTSPCWTAAAADSAFAAAGGLVGTSACSSWRMAVTTGSPGSQNNADYAGISVRVTNSGSNTFTILSGNTGISAQSHVLYGTSQW